MPQNLLIPPNELRLKLDSLYDRLNKRSYVHPDPLEFLYRYKAEQDIEIVALIASSMAFGQVKQILKNTKLILDVLSPSPFKFINKTNNFESYFKNFKYRFITGKEITILLSGIKSVINEYGSLKNCFIEGYKQDDINFLPGVSHLIYKLLLPSKLKHIYLLPDPNRNSACKRIMLFLRWMIRKDNVDPGLWAELPKNKLIVPLDTHMYKIAKKLSLTSRKSADMKTASEITNAFKLINKTDPVKYDFSLTRLGIRNDLCYNELIKN